MINKTQAKKQISQIELNGETIEDPIIMADKFNNFFSNIGPELQKKIPSCNKNPSEYLSKAVPNSIFDETNAIQQIFFDSFIWFLARFLQVVVIVYLTTNQCHVGYLLWGNRHLAGK